MDSSCTSQIVIFETDDSFVASLRATLKVYRRGGWLTIQQAAKLADISTRTLQRRLRAAGWAFSELVDHTRVEMAIEMLQDPGESLNHIANHLGYSNQANFSRAFRRWTGETPANFRCRHTGQHFASPAYGDFAATDAVEPLALASGFSAECSSAAGCRPMSPILVAVCD